MGRVKGGEGSAAPLRPLLAATVNKLTLGLLSELHDLLGPQVGSAARGAHCGKGCCRILGRASEGALRCSLRAARGGAASDATTPCQGQVGSTVRAFRSFRSAIRTPAARGGASLPPHRTKHNCSAARNPIYYLLRWGARWQAGVCHRRDETAHPSEIRPTRGSTHFVHGCVRLSCFPAIFLGL